MQITRGRVTLAIILFSIAGALCSCARDPQRAKAKYLAEGQTYMKKGKFGDAAIEFHPARLDARLDRGRLYLAARQFKDAEDEANFILQRQPNDVGAYQLLGAALIREQKPDKSLAAFGKVTELRPDDPSAYINTALVEINLHRFP